MKMRIEHCLMEIFPQVVAVEPNAEEETGLELNENNIEKVLLEIPAYIVGEPSESLELVAIEEPIGKIHFTRPVAAVTTVVVLSHGNYGRKYYPLQQFTFYSTQTFMFSLGSFMIKEGC
ncbi:nifU-like protein 2, chloroplastic isoform X2 [Rhododendron vialii]|uniref:nifU-like protein 2, chloroplastic isoform X2 n=1 Tax=Rhododendron vialii TaxID=182163 RepID=UPI00265F0CBA|nr:nifU-like protein 2, chloroplastic isoform X2 [Rhododendron vialii]